MNEPAEDVQPVLNKIKADEPAMTHAFTSGRLTNKGKMLFSTNQGAWDFLKKWKGQKFTYEGTTLFHGFDKTSEEQLTSRRTTVAHTALKEIILRTGLVQEHNLKSALEADWDAGMVWLKRKVEPATVFTNLVVYKRQRSDGVWLLVHNSVAQAGLAEFTTAVADKILDTINTTQLGPPQAE